MKTVSRTFRNACLLGAGLCLSGWMLRAASAQVMDQVPSDSLVVLKINHLADTNTKVASLLQSLGVTDLVPTMKDPLQTLEDQLGVGAGLDSKRDAGIALLNGNFAEHGGPPPFVLLLPVSDYKAFLGTMTLVRSEGDVSVVHFKDKEEDAFVENWGSYAALSDKKENISGKHEGIKSTGLTAKQLDEKDLCIYVNFPTLKTLLLPKLKDGNDQAMDEIAKQPDPAKQKVAQAALKQAIAVATEFLNDAQGTTVGISLSSDGISSSTIVELVPDSYLGKMAGQMKHTDQPLLAGLPKENYMYFGGAMEDGKQLAQVMNDVIAPVIQEVVAMGDDGKKLGDAITGWTAALGTVDAGAFGAVAPTAALGQGSMIRFLAIYKGDAELLKSSQAKSMDIMNLATKIFGKGQADLLKTTVTADFKTVKDVKFDRVQMEVNPDNTSQEAMHMSEGFSQMFGPDGFSWQMGVADPKTLVIAMGIDDDLLGQTVDAAKSNKDVLTEDLASVDAGLPKQRSAAFYLGLGQIFTTALSYAKANGMNLPVQIPNNLPPIGFTFGTDGAAMRGDSFLPMKLMQSLVQAGMQVYMQMNNRGGGGGGL